MGRPSFFGYEYAFGGGVARILRKKIKKMHFFCQKFWRFRFLLYLCTTKTEQCSVRLAGPGRKILILEIMGSNPIPSTTKRSTSANAEVFLYNRVAMPCLHECSQPFCTRNNPLRGSIFFVVQLPRGERRGWTSAAQSIPYHSPFGGEELKMEN